MMVIVIVKTEVMSILLMYVIQDHFHVIPKLEKTGSWYSIIMT